MQFQSLCVSSYPPPKIKFRLPPMKTLARPDSPPMETITLQNPFQIPSPHVDAAMDPLSKPLQITQKYKSTVSDLEDQSFSQPLETVKEDERAISSDLKRKSISEPVESSKKYKSTISDLHEEYFSKRLESSQKGPGINLSDVELDSEDELDKWDWDSEDDVCGMTGTEQMILEEEEEERLLREDPAMFYYTGHRWGKRVPPLPPSRPFKDESDDDGIGIERLLRLQREKPPSPSIDDLNCDYERWMERVFEENRKKIEAWGKESREMRHASMNLIV